MERTLSAPQSATPLVKTVRFWQVVGALLVVASASLGISRALFLRKAVEGEGTIVSYQRASGGSRRRSTPGYSPVIEFTGTDGNEHGIVASAEHALPLRPVGTQVTVIYDPAHPREGVERNWTDMWGPTTLAGGIGIFTLLAASIGRSRGWQ